MPNDDDDSRGADLRSVGELLLDADALARRLLMDVRGEDAARVLRTWGEVVQAGAELWAAMPPSPFGPIAREDTATMARLDAVSRGLHRTQLRRGWPGPGEGDARLGELAATLARAADLVQRHGAGIRLNRPGAREDLAAARTRVIHVLYVASHAVGLTVRAYVAGLELLRDNRKPVPDPQGICRGRDMLTRLSVFEQLSGAFLAGRYPGAVHGEKVDVPAGAARLRQALIEWDVNVHRALATTPGGANLLLVSWTQAEITTAVAVLLHAAARAGHLDEVTVGQRLAPALEGSRQAWTAVAGRWADLTAPGARPGLDLVRAAAELRAAIREIGHDKTTWAAPEVIAARLDLREVTATLHQALAAGVDVAHVTCEIAETDQSLRGPARAFAARSRADLDLAAEHTQGPGQDVVWVRPGDIHANRLVPLPFAVRVGLIEASDHVTRAATQVVSAATCLDYHPDPAASTPGPEAACPQVPTAPGDRCHDRRPPTPPTGRSGGVPR